MEIKRLRKAYNDHVIYIQAVVETFGYGKG